MEKWTLCDSCRDPFLPYGYDDYISEDGKTVKRVWDDGEIEYYKTA